MVRTRIKFNSDGFRKILTSNAVKTLVSDHADRIAAAASTPRTIVSVDYKRAAKNVERATRRGKVKENDLKGVLKTRQYVPSIHTTVIKGAYGGGRVVGFVSTRPNDDDEAEASREALEEALHSRG